MNGAPWNCVVTFHTNRISLGLELVWGFLGAEVVKNLPAVQETRIRSLGPENPLEMEMASHAHILGRVNSKDRGTWQATVHGVTKSWTQLSDLTL